MKFSNPDKYNSKPLPSLADNEIESVAWGIREYGGGFERMVVNKPTVGDHDVKFEIKFCGICHTDVHIALNEVGGGGTMYPVVPGHELVGTVVEVGPKVSKVEVGDNVALGCIRDSCLDCGCCQDGDENYCEKGFTHTYNTMKSPIYSHIGGNPDVQNLGGYTQYDVAHEHFLLKIPNGMDLSRAAPLVCAGITMWDPLKHWGATNPDKKLNIGIVGVGGLGTMGIKLAAALGHRVVAISSSKRKEDVARSKGAHNYVVSTDQESLSTEAGALNLILDTVPIHHSIMPYLGLLARDGTLVQLGVASEPMLYPQMALMYKRLSIASSLIGGIPSTQEMVEFCNKHQVYPDVEIVTADKISEVYDDLSENANAGGIRYVIDIKKSLEQ